MTVCIAAICDNARTAIVVADRMAVYGQGSALEFKLDNYAKKIHKVGKSSVLLHSGRAQDAEVLCDELGKPHAKQKLSRNSEEFHLRIDEAVLRLIAHRRNQEVARRIGSNKDYCELLQAVGNLQSGPYYDVLQAVKKNEGFGQFLSLNMVNGIAHMYFHSPPALPFRAELPFAAVGSGGIYAQAALTIQGFSRKASLADAVFQVYSAKKAAECVYGVGAPTDMAILSRSGLREISDAAIETLEEVRAEKANEILSSSQRKQLKKHLAGI